MAITTNRSSVAMARSMTPSMTPEIGRTRRGKYTLVMSGRLPIRLELLSVTALEKNDHGMIPVRTKTG